MVAFNETLLARLLPIGTILVGSTVSVWLHWPMAGGFFGIRGELFSIVAVLLTVLYVAPAARNGNAWDSRIGGALADALTCNSVVKAFDAEVREEERLARILAAWRRHSSWGWMRSNVNGGGQEIMLVALQTLVLGLLLLLWRREVINVGDITLMLTTLFMLLGSLRPIGSNFRHLQRAMNELVNNRKTLVIAHRLSTLRRMDRILVFSHRRIVEQGSHDLISIDNCVYRKLF